MDKKLERIEIPRQLRADENLKRRLWEAAEEDFRSLQDQLRFLVWLGLEAREGGKGKLDLVRIRQVLSGLGVSESGMGTEGNGQ